MKENIQATESAYVAVNSAQQSIAQSSALAIADAIDNLRNLNTLSTTAIGVALSQLVDTCDTKYCSVIEEAQKVVTRGAENIGTVGEKIVTVLHDSIDE